MAEYYYSTQPFLAWCLNHYFYGAKHYVWVATPFYPYRLPNPKSSNPYLIYQDLYLPWKDRDDFDKFIQQVRLDLRKGVKANAGTLTPPSSVRRLNQTCNKVNIVFFYPIVYRVDIDLIPASRLVPAGSAVVGSNEYLIKDLQKSDKFDILFLDFKGDSDIVTLCGGSVTSSKALTILEGRC